ncbi:hypothetical protein B0A48_10404 [Cryoendolithus antarcticus]|uniref:Heterokaryon incompatibility domain-containing protein n=1 Tax=Cryoendolithus antarcticus TaxID=1507870 RepID=A0A1V8SXF9_9PEZI|nr:hypothetical protein B0A48_10404 [Cryoendolithus antarcticus]
MCGPGTIPWQEYYTAAKFLIFDQFDELLDHGTNKGMVGIDMRNTLRKYISGEAISDSEDDEAGDAEDRKIVFLTSCLTDVNQLVSSKREDRIYGVHALYTSLGVAMPEVDYDRPLAHIYADATVAMIRWSGSLRILRDASTSHRDPSLPSWTPDWSDDQARMYMSDHNATSASRLDENDLAALHPTRGCLRVRGRLVGTVHGPGVMIFPMISSLAILSGTAQYRNLSDPDYLRLTIERIAFFRELHRGLRDFSQTREDSSPGEEFYNLLTLGQSSDVFQDLDLFDQWTGFITRSQAAIEQLGARSLALEWKATDTSDPNEWTDEILECTTIAAALLTQWVDRGGEMLDLTRTVVTNLQDRAVIQVDSEQTFPVTIGTTFARTRAGDKVVLLKGASWPVVLRSSSMVWEFVGPAHVLGLMNGEQWDGEGDMNEFVLY